MANNKSAIKRHAQSIKRNSRNSAYKSQIRTAAKKVVDAVKNGDSDWAKSKLAEVRTLLDKSVTKGVLHRNNASRRISRLVTAVNTLGAK
ncbi:MAG: 30S ribosomal protein S20 [Deltaproteobacteria bacterium]|nr:30S ribosomal protein S20 [Deltaproteobacteria bacterium]